MRTTREGHAGMDTIGGMRITGRRLRGPASDLVELEGDNGLRHTAVVFHEEYRSHRGVNGALDVVRSFLESPWVSGLVELVGVDNTAGGFVYPTGQAWSVAETIRILADAGQTAGVRAGLELLFSAGQVLTEAAATGEQQGVYSHGGLTPWRVMLRPSGQTEIIGYALPQVEILLFQEDASRVPRENSFRYCPPERLAAQAESLNADLFALSLIAFELMTGRPVYDGLASDIRQQAARGECTQRLFRFRDTLTPPVSQLLGQALQPDPAGRFETGEDFLRAVRRTLSSLRTSGPSLAEIASLVANHQPRTGPAPESASTMMGTREDFQRLMEQEDDPTGEPAGQVGGPWTPPSGKRNLRRDPPVSQEVEPAQPARVGRVSRVRRSAATAQPAPAPAPAPANAPAPPTANAPAPAPAPAPKKRTRSGRVSAVQRTPRHTLDPAADVTAPERPASPAEKKTSASSGARSGPPPSAEPTAESNKTQILSIPSRRRAAAPAPPAVPAAPEGGDAAPSPAPRLAPSGKADLLERIRATRPSDLSEPPAKRTKKPAKTTKAKRTKKAGGTQPAAAPLVDPGSTFPELPVGTRAAPSTPVPTPAAASSDDTGTRPKRKPTGDAAKEAKARRAAKASAKKTAPAPAPAPAPALAPTPPPISTSKTDIGAHPASRGLSVPWLRAPDPLTSTATDTAGIRHTLRRGGPQGSTFRMRFPRTLSAAEAVCWVVGNRVPHRTDLTGQSLGWWRLFAQGAQVAPDRSMGELPEDNPIDLVFVPAELVMCQVDLQAGGRSLSLWSPVQTTIPMATLLDHIAGRCSLPPGPLTIRVGTTPLSPWSILADLPLLPDPLVLVVRAVETP